MDHKIEWIDNSIVGVSSVTPTETGIRIVFTDGNVYEVNLVEPVAGHERWKSHRLLGICKAVEDEKFGLIPDPKSPCGEKFYELLNGGAESPVFDWNDWVLMGLAQGELDPQGRFIEQSICGFARFQVNPEYERFVGVRSVHESQLQQDEFPQSIISRIEQDGAKTRKRVGEAEHAIKENNVSPNLLAEHTLPKLLAMRPDYAETKKAGGDARGEQLRLRESADQIFPIIINSLPKRILNRKSVLPRITNTSIAQEIAEALVANGNRTPKMNRWIETAPKKKRDSLKRTLQIWIKECRGVMESTTEDIVEKRVQ